MLSVNIDRATQISSAMLAVCGSNSLNQAPACPCCVNLNGDPTIGIDDWLPDMPVSRCPPRTESGNCSP